MIPLVLLALAERYRASNAGRTGNAARDFVVDYRDLLKTAEATDGDAVEQAEKALRVAERESSGVVRLDLQPRDSRIILKVRVRPGGEDWLFQRVGLATPSKQRLELAALFEEGTDVKVPEGWRERWQRWLCTLSGRARTGEVVAPFSRDDLEGNRELLHVLAALLNWPGSSLIRFASCVICGDSKRVEQLRARLEQALTQLSGGETNNLDGLNILETPRTVWVHGPLKLETSRGMIDLEVLERGARITHHDLESASVTTTASRCLSIENETTFHELAKQNSGTLLIQTSYPGKAALALFAGLPKGLPCWHFGDCDPAGYDILRDLRERTKRAIEPLHMQWRDDPESALLTEKERGMIARLMKAPCMGDVLADLTAMLNAGRKGSFEQERWGWPRAEWPFYGG